MQMLPTNAELLSWETFSEDISSADEDSKITVVGLLEQLNVTRDTSDYLWYMTSVEISPSESFLHSGQHLTLTVQSAGDALHVFTDGQLFEIMDKLVKEGILSKSGTDSYTINKQKESAYKFNAVKEEMDVPDGKKAEQGMGEDHMYMKALYHALPMNYITATKLQDELEGEANKTTERKLIDKMTHDGFLDAKSNRRLGKRVIHSDLTEKKLMEVKKVLDIDAMDLDINESHNKSNHVEFQKIGINRDMSTCGMLHSIGSDLTSTRGGSETHQNGSLRSEQNGSRARDHGNAPTSRAEGDDASVNWSFSNTASKPSAVTLPLMCATEYQNYPQSFRLPASSPYDNFLKAAGC